MLESPIASIISMAKRKVRKISAQKFPPLEFIKENEEKEIQTADYSSKIEKEDTNKEKTVRLSDEVERIKEPTVDPIKMAENPKPVKNPKPIRKVESKEVAHKNLR